VDTLTKDVNLRGSSARQFRLIDEKTGEELETLSEQYALREGYPGSIYSVSQNNKLVSYRCGNWQREDCVIPVEALAIDAEYRTTEPDAEFKIELMSEIAQPKTIPALEGGLLAQLHWGRYCQQVSGFEEFVYERSGKCGNRNCSLHGKPVKGRLECSQCRHQLIDRKEEKKSVASVSYEEPLTLEFETPILQLKFTLELAEKIKAFVQSERAALEQQFPREEDRPEIYCLLNSGSPLKLAYHALLHAIKKPIPLILLASEKDIGEVVDCNLEVGFAFDAVPEGSGSVSALFGSLEEAIAKGWELLTTCECQSESGCPRCLSDRQCLDRNEHLIKYLGIWLLDQFVAS
jgi:DEAD/DEAH box helicase domain-containing protein